MPRSRRFPVPANGRKASRRFNLRTRRLVALVGAFLVAPFALGLYDLGSTVRATIDDLRARNAQLALDASVHRKAAEHLNGQLPALLAAVEDLAERIGMDPAVRTAVEHLPDATQATPGRPDSDELDAAGEIFEQLRDLLESLQDALDVVTLGVAHREALADATPTIWPADGWISAGYGYRDDPFTGQRDFHPAVDISTRKGQPVYATAAGRVTRASRNGAYGNLVEINHGFGLTTRYGHLSEFIVAAGDTVVRGDVIGSVGATGRATGHHVHYEVRADGRAINPRRLLVDAHATVTD